MNEWYLKELLVLDRNTWNHLTVCKQMSSFENNENNYSFKNHIYLVYIYIYIYILLCDFFDYTHTHTHTHTYVSIDDIVCYIRK